MDAMISPGDLAEHLERMALALPFAIDREVRLLTDSAAEHAKRMIGREDNGWPALAERTIAEKQKLGFTGQVSDTDPLLRKGELRESIEAETDTVADTTTGIIASDDQVAVYQELGTNTIPPRPFIGPSFVNVEAAAPEVFGHLAMRALTPSEKL